MASLDMEHWDIRALPGFHTLFALEPQLRGPHRPLGRLQLNTPQLDHTTELIQQLNAETRTKPQGYRVMARGLFSQLVVYLSRCYSEMPASDSLDLLRLGDAIAHIETHYPNHITLEELARTAHMSPRHFQRLFRRTTGYPAFEHLLRVRLRHAAELLRNTTRTITDIAYSCGFRDSNYFSRCFRQYMEQSPSHYRRSHA
jgi:transcriptional regulator GlxA family with amidase domain